MAQFKIPDEGVLASEDKALRAMVPGPYRWCVKEDLFSLATHYGQARSFPSLEHMGIAARCRMVHFENSSSGGLRIQEKDGTVTQAMALSPLCLGRQQLWFYWFRYGILQDMFCSHAQVQVAGLSIEDLKEKAAGPRDDDDPPHARRKLMKKHFQKTIRKELDKKFEVNPVSRMRFKLDRWNLPGFPGITAVRYLRALDSLKKLLPPRVAAASLRTAWNGWCTSRRFQGSGPCVFGCGSFSQEDSLEHYSGCRACVTFLRGRLNYQGPIDRGHLLVLGVNISFPEREDLMRLALWCYVLYRTFNKLRCADYRSHRCSDLGGMMEQYLREAIAGDDGAILFAKNCWNPRYRHQATETGTEGMDVDARSGLLVQA